MNVLTHILKTTWEEANKSIIHTGSDDFEQYVRYTIFPSASYEQLEKACNYCMDSDNFLESLQLPDLKFVSRSLGLEFFIETRFRSRFQDQIPEWCKFFQLKHYQELNNVTPVLICIGLGGRPSAPAQLFLIPVKHIKFVKLYPGILQKYEIPANQPVSEHALRRILE
jgi:hypothetical protein